MRYTNGLIVKIGDVVYKGYKDANNNEKSYSVVGMNEQNGALYLDDDTAIHVSNAVLKGNLMEPQPKQNNDVKDHISAIKTTLDVAKAFQEAGGAVSVLNYMTVPEFINACVNNGIEIIVKYKK